MEPGAQFIAWTPNEQRRLSETECRLRVPSGQFSGARMASLRSGRTREIPRALAVAGLSATSGKIVPVSGLFADDNFAIKASLFDLLCVIEQD